MTTRVNEAEAKRILVVANETAGGATLPAMVRARVRGQPRAEVLVVAPALNSRLRHWLSDDRDARRRAEARLRTAVDRITADGVSVNGLVGDADPLQAIADALGVFSADEIVITTHPEGRSNWLAANVVERARGRHAIPIAHVVVDVRDTIELFARSTAMPAAA
jgi:hypothetical protein